MTERPTRDQELHTAVGRLKRRAYEKDQDEIRREVWWRVLWMERLLPERPPEER